MLLLALFACAGPLEEAPATLDDLTRITIQEFDDPLVGEDIAALRTWLSDNRQEWDAEEFSGGYTLGSIDGDDVSNVEHSENTNWEEVLGAGVPLVMRGTLDGYAEASTETDQAFADPSTYIEWTRTITSGDPAVFLGGGTMTTENVIVKSGPLGVVLPYEAKKDFRWFDDVLAARTWVPTEGWGEDGNNGIICGFTIELWFEEDGEVLWYNGSWTQIATALGDGLAEDFLIQQFINGTIDYMEGTEAFVMGEYVPEE